jgi:hypothetical protein
MAHKTRAGAGEGLAKVGEFMPELHQRRVGIAHQLLVEALDRTVWPRSDGGQCPPYGYLIFKEQAPRNAVRRHYII